MGLFSKKLKTHFFSEAEKQLIVSAVQSAERTTSGEVRVFVESKCRYMDAIDRAVEVFYALKMDKTDDRNAVLVYIAFRDRQLAVFGDEGIHRRLGQEYWSKTVQGLLANFNRTDYAKGIAECVTAIGHALHAEFPFDKDTDKNELPDEIVFGH